MPHFQSVRQITHCKDEARITNGLAASACFMTNEKGSAIPANTLSHAGPSERCPEMCGSHEVESNKNHLSHRQKLIRVLIS